VITGSSFSFSQLWSQGDSVSQCVTTILVSMSILTWAVIIHKVMIQYYQRQCAKKIEQFWHTNGLSQGLLALGPSRHNHFYVLARRGHEAFVHIQHSHSKATHDTPLQLHDRLDISDWVTRGLQQSIDTSAASMQSGLALLGSVGSTAPFIGLFGTVWGIYHALIGLSHPQGSQAQTSIDLVAGPIGEALIMTALGLAVAIPAVLAYNALMRGNKTHVSALNWFAHDLHAYFVTGARVDQGDADVIYPSN